MSPNPQLVKYVNDSRAAGVSDQQIKTALTQQGWQTQDIDMAMNPPSTKDNVNSVKQAASQGKRDVRSVKNKVNRAGYKARKTKNFFQRLKDKFSKK